MGRVAGFRLNLFDGCRALRAWWSFGAWREEPTCGFVLVTAVRSPPVPQFSATRGISQTREPAILQRAAFFKHQRRRRSLRVRKSRYVRRWRGRALRKAREVCVLLGTLASGGSATCASFGSRRGTQSRTVHLVEVPKQRRGPKLHLPRKAKRGHAPPAVARAFLGRFGLASHRWQAKVVLVAGS